MAEQIPFNIIADVLTKLGSSTFRQIGSACGVGRELTKLAKKLETIRGVLADAERKQEESDAVKAWVRRLKDVVYQSDDLLDDFATHQLQGGGVAKQVRDFFSSSNQLLFRFEMSDRLKDIKEEVDEIVQEIPILGLIQRNIIHREELCSRRETHSFVLASEMVERDEDREEIVKLLVSSGNQKILSAVAIIGIGGLGKTTLAQLVFNDKRVAEFFEAKIWIYIRDDFDVKLLVKRILESLSGEIVGNLGLEVLKVSLHEKLRQKRYFIVLDDVWDDDFQSWERLRTLLTVGAKGSKILVTTRNRNVASAMGIDYFPIYLKGLKKAQSWDLFSKMAFKECQERLYPSLVEIGQEIVNRCNGVPLIIKTLGAMLRFKTEEHQWRSVKNNENLLLLAGGNNDGVLSVLKLSYDDLPFDLKPCFAYCALFPKDYVIEKKLLVQLWMAQGYIDASQVGNLYFEELLSRSLLEEVKKDAYNNISSCKMQDLIHDLAQSIVRSEVLVLRENQENILVSKDTKMEILGRVHHVSFFLAKNIHWKDLNVKHVRTLLKFERYFENFSITGKLVPNFKHTRVLSLHGTITKKLPKSIGKLSHLRYLDLSYHVFKALPNAITRLCNLQTLKLIDCRHLKEFPEDAKEMINLRHLENDGCWSLTHMPSGIGELTLLESLPLFTLGTGNRTGRLSELKMLNNLKGELRIKQLENVRDAKAESKEANMGEKQHIESLGLEWSYSEEAQSGEAAESVMMGLQPHQNLKGLCIRGYGGRGFPSWMMNNGFSCMLPNLITINLENCSGCLILPPFVKLPRLKCLKLVSLEKVEYVDSCSSQGLFPSLEYLELKHMPNLKALWRRDLPTHSPPSFPQLSELRIMYCDELASIEMHSSPHLSNLHIKNCSDLASLELQSSPLISSIYISHCLELTSLKLPSLPCLGKLELYEVKEGIFQEFMLLVTASSLEHASICNIDDLISLPDELCQHVSSLQTLQIVGCSHLAMLPQWLGSLISLGELQIRNCPELTLLPQEMRSLTSLHSLSIDYSCGLALLPDWIHSLTSLTYLQIGSCPQLTSLPEELSSLGILTSLTIHHWSVLTTLPEWIGNLTSLTDLVIGSCPQLTSLPEQLCSLKILKRLTIHDWSGLKSLPEWIDSLSSLEDLQISDCPFLTSLPEKMCFLTTLKTLDISGCPHLSKRCQREKGQDWRKIAHVGRKYIDGEWA